MRTRFHAAPATPAHWLSRNRRACWLRPLAALYGAVVALNQLLYRLGLRQRNPLPVPVIVVGNVIAGGAGKTPSTIAIVKHLQSQGWQPGIISRGYGRQQRAGGADVRAVTASDDARWVGDEPLLMSRHNPGVPIYVGRQRAAAGQALLAQHPQVDVLVCDDGLQHLALARDLEICVFDERGLGNGWLLPAGPLREPWPRRLRPAPPMLVLHTGVQRAAALAAWGWLAPRRLAEYALNASGQRVALAELRSAEIQARLVAIAGIARPCAFFEMLHQTGLRPPLELSFGDHHVYQHADLAPYEGQLLLCTEKDAVKIWPLRPDALAVPLQLDVPADFWQQLDRSLAAIR
jgi:tetraacyldisaccharide 4'-kinase